MKLKRFYAFVGFRRKRVNMRMKFINFDKFKKINVLYHKIKVVDHIKNEQKI